MTKENFLSKIYQNEKAKHTLDE